MFYNWNVIGHTQELSRLEEDFKSGNIHHAYLFVGPEKVGKFRVAKTMAEILQCPNNFCHACPTCAQIEKKCHPDTIELEDDGESIKIGAVREIISRLSMTGQGRYKILLIQNIGRLTEEASNCLLKTLEEPTGKTIFLFTAGQLRDISGTIASRMRIVHFKKLHDDVLREALRKEYPETDDETLNQVILLSLGRSGRALQLLKNPEVFQDLRDLYRQIQFLGEKAQIATRILTVAEISQNPQKIKTFLALLTHYVRQKLLSSKTPEEKQHAVATIEEIHRVIDLLARNVNPRLLLENIMISL
jgi:DNA polymerase-3 subunit delta'